MKEKVPGLVRAIGVGSEIAFSVLGGGFLGYKAGEQFEMSSIGLVLGVFIGFIGGIYGVYRIFK